MFSKVAAIAVGGVAVDGQSSTELILITGFKDIL